MPWEWDEIEEETHLLDEQNNTLNLDLERAKSKQASLFVIRGSPAGRRFSLNADKLTIGRDPAAEIRLNNAKVSRRHAEVRRIDQGFTVDDLGSRNGTYLNDVALESAVRLKKEDKIKIGTTILKYIPAGELEILFLQSLTDAAYLDDLTDLYNRAYMSQVSAAEFKQAKTLRKPLAMALIDVDGFKTINDRHGHEAGDCVIAELARVLKGGGLREGDILGRYGGDEFLLLFTSSTPEQAIRTAEALRRAVAVHTFLYQGTTIPVAVSLGLSVLRAVHSLPNDLFRETDHALYASKENGKNRVTVFDPTISSSGDEDS